MGEGTHCGPLGRSHRPRTRRSVAGESTRSTATTPTSCYSAGRVGDDEAGLPDADAAESVVPCRWTRRRTRDVITAMSDEFQLPTDERVEMTPSGRARLMDNKVGWSLTHLSRRDCCSDLVAFKSVSPKQASTF